MKYPLISLLIVLTLLLNVMIACQPAQSTLKEFQGEEGNLFKLTFSYPSNWSWEVSPNGDKFYNGLTVFNPYDDVEEMTASKGLIGIDVWVSSMPRVEMQESIDSHLKGIDAIDRLILLSDDKRKIDGHDARLLIIKNTWERENPGVTYIHEFIYLLAEDRYYTITLYIPESEVDGRFHQEFKAMVESIQFLP